MKLDKAQKLAKGKSVKVNKESYKVMEIHKEEGTIQYLLTKEESFFVLSMPEKGDGDCQMFNLNAHGDHFHPGEEVKVKTIDV